MSNYEHDRIRKVLPEIEARTSPTFCLAKWHHVTIYLHLGETHSCYHPQPHTIPLDELKNNPSALHNTKEKKLEQQKVIAETLNGRLAMLGLVAAATSDLLTGHMFFGIF